MTHTITKGMNFTLYLNGYQYVVSHTGIFTMLTNFCLVAGSGFPSRIDLQFVDRPTFGRAP